MTTKNYSNFFTELVDENANRVSLVNYPGELAQCLRHDPRLQTALHIAHVTFQLRKWNKCGNAVHNDDVKRTAADEVLSDFKSLLCRIGL